MAKQPKINTGLTAVEATQLEVDHTSNEVYDEDISTSPVNESNKRYQNIITGLKVLVVNKSNMVLPKYETLNSAGLDVRANLTAPTVLPAHGKMLIGTGLFVAIPEGYECQVRPRSGLALKHGITVLNTPGTIDAKVA